jgi:hypothetical protein
MSLCHHLDFYRHRESATTVMAALVAIPEVVAVKVIGAPVVASMVQTGATHKQQAGDYQRLWAVVVHQQLVFLHRHRTFA